MASFSFWKFDLWILARHLVLYWSVFFTEVSKWWLFHFDFTEIQSSKPLILRSYEPVPSFFLVENEKLVEFGLCVFEEPEIVGHEAGGWRVFRGLLLLLQALFLNYSSSIATLISLLVIFARDVFLARGCSLVHGNRSWRIHTIVRLSRKETLMLFWFAILDSSGHRSFPESAPSVLSVAIVRLRARSRPGAWGAGAIALVHVAPDCLVSAARVAVFASSGGFGWFEHTLRHHILHRDGIVGLVGGGGEFWAGGGVEGGRGRHLVELLLLLLLLLQLAPVVRIGVAATAHNVIRVRGRAVQ